jgi:predicted transcriptional regulator
MVEWFNAHAWKMTQPFSRVIRPHPGLDYQWFPEFGIILNNHEFAQKAATSIKWQYQISRLDKVHLAAQIIFMSNKQIVEDLLQRIPDDASLRDIVREIEFVSAVREGLAELDRGERIPIEEVERELPSWIIK